MTKLLSNIVRRIILNMLNLIHICLLLYIKLKLYVENLANLCLKIHVKESKNKSFRLKNVIF